MHLNRVVPALLPHPPPPPHSDPPPIMSLPILSRPNLIPMPPPPSTSSSSTLTLSLVAGGARTTAPSTPHPLSLSSPLPPHTTPLPLSTSLPHPPPLALAASSDLRPSASSL